ncbi:hypothetical protein QOZ96_002348 [Brevundimonas nasdae]|jgi:hypothetical protein|uniref:DUF2271 domain-containing protein n=2 Tax=Brevundimonas TaxID=41275 RepID=A0ABX8TGU0_9CAUL|nr:DUF2271 domain-containing protein [Brevundimonas nasdae]MBK6025755.1 DUF2271 domain-containing protein [Brevundimonas nasdae]MDQ0452395.1 hypothetical protein [Brevundimonas nasdae]QYC10448.1 DUF2271 domain-containing protein [Brevundimonas nasdae]QYC13235.1 DUF2271 domain-containing protein [Brevundimonas nasdae]
MRILPVVITTAGLAVAAPAFAADLSVSVEIPRLNTASYHRPYVAVWIEKPDQTAERTLAVWYQQTRNNEGDGKDWLKDLRTWWRKGGRAMALPADGVSGATRAPGRQTITVPAARLNGLQPGQYSLVVEAARELGGREVVRVPFRWGAANTANAAGSTELGAVSVTVSR